SRLSSEIHGRHLLATVTHLVADHLARFAIALLLLLGELLRRRAAPRGAFPAGELVVSLLRVAMTMAVDAVNADPLALVAEMLEIGVVGLVAGCHQALALGERLRLIEELPLFGGADGN